MTSPSASHQAINFNGAAVIDANGREIPITESMIQQALNRAQANEASSYSYLHLVHSANPVSC